MIDTSENTQKDPNKIIYFKNWKKQAKEEQRR
jgi:hypothetical protein